MIFLEIFVELFQFVLPSSDLVLFSWSTTQHTLELEKVLVLTLYSKTFFLFQILPNTQHELHEINVIEIELIKFAFR